jgi:tetratricopeptide (TPR) repeat protein
MNAEGWAALAHYHTYFGWDWQLADYAFNKADELNPNMAYNHYHRAWYLALFGRMNEAIEEHKKAQELDPFTPLHFAWLGELYRWVGLYEAGLAEAEKAAQTQGDYALSMFIKGRILLDQGKIEDALEALRKASKVNWGWKFLGYGPALIQTGHLEEGNEIIRELEAMEPSAFTALCLSYMYIKLKEYDKAFEWLPRAQKHAFYPWIRVMVKDEEILRDPRFLELIREMNLPDPAPLVFDPNA